MESQFSYVDCKPVAWPSLVSLPPHTGGGQAPLPSCLSHLPRCCSFQGAGRFPSGPFAGGDGRLHSLTAFPASRVPSSIGPRVWIWLKWEMLRGWIRATDQRKGGSGGRLQGRWSPLHAAACCGLPGGGSTLGTSTREPRPAAATPPQPTLAPVGPDLPPCLHQPGWLGLHRAAVASGQSRPGLSSSLRPISSSSHTVASPWETGGRPGMSGGESWRGVSLP